MRSRYATSSEGRLARGRKSDLPIGVYRNEMSCRAAFIGADAGRAERRIKHIATGHAFKYDILHHRFEGGG